MERGDVMRSLAGKDRGSLLVVLAAGPEDEERGDIRSVLVADGKHRPVDRPKRKNPRHLEPIGCKAGEEPMATNRALRKFLSSVTDDTAAERER